MSRDPGIWTGAGERGTVRNWRDIFYTSRDDLRLYARHYAAPSPSSSRRAVLCLPGLTRNVRDFHALATFLSSASNPAARDVFALDYRGRGRSQHDLNWSNYTLNVEALDVLDFLTISELHDIAVIGTSRGGLVAILLAALRPAALGAVVLNDVGPVLEREGIARILAYAGRVPLPGSWAEATELVRDLNRRQFPKVSDAEWAEIARDVFDDVNGLPANSYDQNLTRSVSLLDGPLPELWPQFRALFHVPTLAIRGANSDILSDATLQEMRVQHPRLDTFVVPAQGHAPLLRDLDTQSAINTFLAATD